jgi:hypothetical protein
MSVKVTCVDLKITILVDEPGTDATMRYTICLCKHLEMFLKCHYVTTEAVVTGGNGITLFYV